MNYYNKAILKAGLNRMLEDGQSSIQKSLILTFSKGDMLTCKLALKEWSDRSLLKIISDLEKSQDKDICIHLKSFIDQVSPIPNYMNQEYSEQMLRNAINDHMLMGKDHVLYKYNTFMGQNDFGLVTKSLKSWQNEGYLEIIDEPASLQHGEPCVKMLSLIP